MLEETVNLNCASVSRLSIQAADGARKALQFR